MAIDAKERNAEFKKAQEKQAKKRKEDAKAQAKALEEIRKEAEERKAKLDAIEAEKQRKSDGTMPQQLSKQAKQLDMLASMLMTASKSFKDIRVKYVMAENKANGLRHKNSEAEKHLAMVQRKADTALSQATLGNRALSDKLAVEKGRNSDFEARLNAREKELTRAHQELEEMKALYQDKLDQLAKINKVPGD